MGFLSMAMLSLSLLACETADDSSTEVRISLNEEAITITPNQEFKLEVTLTPTSNDAISWSSSDETVATVFFGEVTPKSEGTTIVTASIETGKSASCKVTVKNGEYELVWSDEFDGNELNLDNWDYIINGNGNGNQEKQYYTNDPKNIRVIDGVLEIEARRENKEWAEYTSARITSKDKQDFTYGKFEARIEVAKGGGVWPAWWMMGYGSWPMCGEIDILEYVGNTPGKAIHALHTYSKNGMYGNNWSANPTIEGIEDGFHTFGIEWEKSALQGRDVIRFFVDGAQTGECYDPIATEDDAQWPYVDDFYLLLNLAVGGTLGGNIDTTIFDDPEGSPVIMKVDYVRVYQRK